MSYFKTQGKRRFEEIGINIDEEQAVKQTASLAEVKSVEVLENLVSSFNEKNAIEELINNAPEVKEIDVGSLIKLVHTLEKSALKNSQMRAKYAETPEKFMQSEIDLAEAIKAMNGVTVVPKLYNKLVQHNFLKVVFELLSHENTDIVIETINLLSDLLDPFTILEDKSTLTFLESAEEKNIFDLVVKNLERLSESEEDSNGLYNALSIFENLMEIDLKYFLHIISRTNLIKFLIALIKNDKFEDKTNEIYSAELLANFVNLAPDICTIFIDMGICDTINAAFQKYSSKTYITAEETEFINNLLDVLTTIFIVKPDNKILTPYLMRTLLLFVKKKKFKCRISALNALASCLINVPEYCMMFIDEKGLKIAFFEFIKRAEAIKKKISQNSIILPEEDEIIEQLVIIFIQCFLHLKEIYYLRFLRKFEEKENEKIDKLVELFDHYFSKLEDIDKKLAGDQKLQRFSPKKKYLFRYDKGGYILSVISIAISFLCTSGNEKTKKRVMQVLSQHDMSIDDVFNVVNEFRDYMEGEDLKNNAISRDIVENLLKIMADQIYKINE